MIIFIVPVPKTIQLNTENLSKPAFLNYFFYLSNRWVKPILFYNEQSFISSFSSTDHFATVLNSQSHWLFTKHMKPCFQCLNRMQSMQSIRAANRNHIGLFGAL